MSRSNQTETYALTFAWGIDFWRAFLERPKVLRWLARIAMGKYAYREMYGDVIDINVIEYGLTKMDYHKDKVKT